MFITIKFDKEIMFAYSKKEIKKFIIKILYMFATDIELLFIMNRCVGHKHEPSL